MACGLVKALAPQVGQRVVGPAPHRFRMQPFFLDQTKYRGANQSLVEFQGLQQLHQAAQPDPPATQQNGITKHRDDERARLHAALLPEVVQTLVDGGNHKCG
jgi:hypothetical protein